MSDDSGEPVSQKYNNLLEAGQCNKSMSCCRLFRCYKNALSDEKKATGQGAKTAADGPTLATLRLADEKRRHGLSQLQK
jgi:hypothetical protein